MVSSSYSTRRDFDNELGIDSRLLSVGRSRRIRNRHGFPDLLHSSESWCRGRSVPLVLVVWIIGAERAKELIVSSKAEYDGGRGVLHEKRGGYSSSESPGRKRW